MTLIVDSESNDTRGESRQATNTSLNIYRPHESIRSVLEVVSFTVFSVRLNFSGRCYTEGPTVGL